MKILIVTGGTGGHIYPAIALADYVKKERDATILFVGNDDRMETEIVPASGYAFQSIHTSGFSGSIVSKLKAGVQSVRAIKKAKIILKEFKPDIVIGFGGYVSVPVVYAAHQLGIKTMLHEQNSVIGAANKMLAKYADMVVVCYEKVISEFNREHVYLLGNPRASVAAQNTFQQEVFDQLGLGATRKKGLIVMGSLGSTSINEIMKDVLKAIESVDFLYVSGKKSYEEAKNMLQADNVKVVDYVNQLEVLDGFDFIVARAGATTAAEIAAKGICSILIPSPYVAHNHQFYNAKSLVDANAAFMIEEKDLNSDTLYGKIEMILRNQELQSEMSKEAKRCSFPNACRDILDLIENNM